MRAFIRVDRDLTTNLMHVKIGNGERWYRITGPKYAPMSVMVRKMQLTEKDAEQIRDFLDAAFPPPKEKE